ncbi:MAG: hypothetical protein A2269_04315 [Lentisphaerae bacterium RIFOXYA12_FULL_60_10]|nr:MAG: hypothetical protein A2269_04315 [Lentisphaerae bacterium RIFOXYA12_FULL_60_10]
MILASPYAKFEGDSLILRDELAVDRTLLANERTLLAYLRSSISMLIAGVSIIHFSEAGWFYAIGVACIPTGIVIGHFGIKRYLKMNRSITLVRKLSSQKRKPVDPSV